VWTPERHFQTFGGLYPNPSVLGAALAMITERVQIRAGSVVLSLHSPVRVAEEWAVVDNLSNGRVALSFATGWHAHDYVIAPEAYADRRALMLQRIPIVRQLWAGETVLLPGVDGKPTPVRTFPRPLQAELPVWITASSPATWHSAGAIGANILTGLSSSLETLEQHIQSYRQARVQHGHDPRDGIVSLMLHTYLGTDIESTRARVREPLKAYLQNYVEQFRPLLAEAALEQSFSNADTLLDFAFERYFTYSALLGTPDKCAAMLDALCALGVDEVACLLDFGLDLPSVLESLERLHALAQRYSGAATVNQVP
jgi:natural product biosynthesis luciferase-like monooxygenase protein